MSPNMQQEHQIRDRLDIALPGLIVFRLQAKHGRTVLERQIAATDRQIDQLVYQLYGLTDDEIALVEGGIPK